MKRREFFRKSAVGGALLATGSAGVASAVSVEHPIQFWRGLGGGDALVRAGLRAVESPSRFGITINEVWSCLGGKGNFYTSNLFHSPLRGDDLVLAAGYHSRVHYEEIWSKVVKWMERYGVEVAIEQPAFYHNDCSRPMESMYIHILDSLHQDFKFSGPWEIS